MPKRKHKKKNVIIPRDDANQGIWERNERIEREKRHYAKKLAEYQAQQEMERQQQMSTASKTIDGMQSE